MCIGLIRCNFTFNYDYAVVAKDALDCMKRTHKRAMVMNSLSFILNTVKSCNVTFIPYMLLVLNMFEFLL